MSGWSGRSVTGRFWLARVSPRLACATVLAVGAAAFGASVAMADVWSPQSSGTSEQLNGVACGSESQCVSVGAAGTVVATTDGGSSWSPQTSGTDTALQGVACPSGSDCYALGNDGTIIRTSDGGTLWVAAASGTVSDLEGISCTSTSACVAVGAAGTILSSTDSGATWTPAASSVTGQLASVSCTWQTCVAVGASGEIASSTDGGSNWTSQSSGTSQDLDSVSCSSSGDCMAVGSDGTVDESTDSGSTWTMQSSTTGNVPSGLACLSDSACWVVGGGGTIEATTDDGSSWTAQSSATNEQLNSVACGSGECLAVGADGTTATATAPSNTTPPSIAGTDTSGQTLTASSSWQGSTPVNYSYQWLSCNPNADDCFPISGAIASSYQLTDADVGSTVEVSVTASNTEGSTTAASAAASLVEPVSGPACTDAWLAGSGAWETGANWSTGAAPAPSDVACLRGGSQPSITASALTGTLQAVGATITVDSGELDLSGSSDPSKIGSLDLDGGTLDTEDQVTIDNALGWTAGTITGPGTITLGASSTSTITPASSTSIPELDGATLDNTGTLSIDCSNPTGSLGESDITGADGADLDNNGTLNVGTNRGQLCAFEQGAGSASTLANDMTLNIGASSFVGWEMGNDATGSVAVSRRSLLVLAGGEAGGTPEAGSWSGTDLILASGSYDFPDPTNVILADLDVGTSTADSDPFDALIDGSSPPASLIVPAANWPNTFVTSYGGTTSLGDTSAPSSFAVIDTWGGNLTLTSPNSSQSTIGPIGAIGGQISLYGQTESPDVEVGYGDYPPMYTGVLNQDGTLTMSPDQWAPYGGGSGPPLTIWPGSVLHQNGDLILETTDTAGEYSPDVSGWSQSSLSWYSGPPLSAPLIDGGGEILVQESGLHDPNPVLGSCAAMFENIAIENQTIVNNAPACGVWLAATTTSNVTIANDGSLLVDNVTAAGGTSLNNYGVLYNGNGQGLLNAPGEGDGALVNEASGSMQAAGSDPPLLVNWSFTNSGGSVQPAAFLFQQDDPATYGGSNPAAPSWDIVGCGDPVVCATGDQTEQQTDLSVGGLGGLTLVRTYNSQLAASQVTPGMLGYGWTSSVDAHLWINSDLGTATVQQPNGSMASFTRNSDGSFTPEVGIEATLTKNGDGSYDYALPSQETYVFNNSEELVSETNKAGLTTSLSYNDQGQLTTVTAPSGRQISFTYNPQGTVATATDPAGLVVNYSYDSADDLTSVSDSAGPATTRWQFGYDEAHELSSMTDGRGNTTYINYAGGLVTSQTDPLNRTRTWSYSQGQTLVTSPAGNVTEYLFNGQNEPLSITRGLGTSGQSTQTLVYNTAGESTSVTDGNGQATTYAYDSAGNQTSETDPKARTTSWTYDSRRDMLTQTLPSGLQDSYTYDEKGLPTQAAVSGSSGGLSETTGYSYNDQTELTSETDARGKTTTYTYDTFGDVASVTDPVGNETTYSYDTDGRETSSVAPAGNASGGDPLAHTTSLVYDALGDLTSRTDPLGNSTTYTYDPNQNRTSVTDANGQTSSYAYDADNELTTVTRPDSSSLTYGYDADGNRTSQTDGAGNTTSYTYDPLDQLASTTDPLTRTTSYSYDLAGNLTSSTDPADRTTTYGYDDANELISISYSDGQTPNVTYTYTADGLRSSMSDGTGATSYTYDPLDRLSSETNGDGQQVSYGYDPAGNVTSIGYPTGQTVTRTFDDDERLSSVSDWLGNTTTFAYNPDSTLNTTTFPSATSDVDSYGYDHADQLTSIQIAKGTTTLASLNYTRDPAGMVSNETQTGLPGAGSTDYSYTSLNQVSTAGSNGDVYDAADNVTQLDGTSGYTYDAADQLTSSPSASYSYDGLGERTSSTPTDGSATGYSYDQAGRLTAVTPPTGDPTSYAYDGDGLRASKTTGASTSHFAWDQTASLPLVLTDGENNYLYGPGDQPFEQIDSSGNPAYLHHDQLGSTRLITGQAGDITSTFTYNPYGALNASTGTGSTPLGYAGQYTDPNTGLIYLRARYYDPSTGQFISRDPLEALTRQPYAYAQDDPVNGTDPSGLAAQFCLGGTATVSIPFTSIGVSVGAQVCAVFTPNGDGITIGGGIGQGAGEGGYVTVGGGYSNACSPSDYGGPFVDGGAGGAFGPIGGYVQGFSNKPITQVTGGRTTSGVSGGWAVGAGASASGLVTETPIVISF